MPAADSKRASIYSVDLRPGHPPTGYFISFVHLLKGNIGVGLFAMGDAYKNGGLYVSPCLTLLIALVCIHCQHQLVNCADMVSREYRMLEQPVDYAIAVELCFENGPRKFVNWSEKMGVCVNIFICVTQLGFCCVYLVFISSNLHQILEANGITIDLRILILIVWLPIWLSCLITNLKALAPVSMTANILMVGSFMATISLAFLDSTPHPGVRVAYTNPRQLALFFGTMIFAFEGIALVLPIKNVMKKPENFAKPLGVLNVGMFFVVALFVFSGISGYHIYGEDVMGSLTLNLGDSIAAQCVKVAVSLGIMLTYPLQFYVPVQVILPTFLRKTKLYNREVLGEFIFRTLLTIVTVIIAEIVPNVGMFISLIGALCATGLALIFPPIIECLLLNQKFESNFVKGLVLFKNILIILLGLLGFTVGTFVSLMEIVIYFKESIGKENVS